jgi:hypothetical protein
VGKGKLLPVKATLAIAPGLDGFILQQVNHHMNLKLLGELATSADYDVLFKLDQVLGQYRPTVDQGVIFYGYELTGLYCFLVDMAFLFPEAVQDFVPAPNRNKVRLELSVLIDQIDKLLVTVDAYADRPGVERPVSGIG